MRSGVMSELEKLEFIHSTLQEVLQSEYKDMVETSIEFIEEIREKYYDYYKKDKE